MKVQKVVEIHSWKQAQKAHKEESELNDYLRVLSFNELITEAQTVIKELKAGKLTTDLSSRSTTIMNEFNKRIEIESPELANYLKINNSSLLQPL